MSPAKPAVEARKSESSERRASDWGLAASIRKPESPNRGTESLQMFAHIRNEASLRSSARLSKRVQALRNEIGIKDTQPHANNVKKAPAHDAPPGPRSNLQRKALKDARVNNRQGEQPGSRTLRRLNSPRRPGQAQGGPKKKMQKRLTRARLQRSRPMNKLSPFTWQPELRPFVS